MRSKPTRFNPSPKEIAIYGYIPDNKSDYLDIKLGAFLTYRRRSTSLQMRKMGLMPNLNFSFPNVPKKFL